MTTNPLFPIIWVIFNATICITTAICIKTDDQKLKIILITETIIWLILAGGILYERGIS